MYSGQPILPTWHAPDKVESIYADNDLFASTIKNVCIGDYLSCSPPIESSAVMSQKTCPDNSLKPQPERASQKNPVTEQEHVWLMKHSKCWPLFKTEDNGDDEGSTLGESIFDENLMVDGSVSEENEDIGALNICQVSLFLSFSVFAYHSTLLVKLQLRSWNRVQEHNTLCCRTKN